jgi:hypothetical protein
MSQKIIILYTNVVGKSDPEAPNPSYYDEPTSRFFETYQKFKPSIPHRLGVINCGKIDPTHFHEKPADEQFFYTGTGWDTGALQQISKGLDCDLIVCFNSFAYFWRHNWLEPVVEAFHKHGHGVYGFTASFEITPHLRSPAICFSPIVINSYPHLIDSRNKTRLFESFQLNFSLWAISNLYPVLLVTANEVCRIHQWRTPPNIFRRGDQSNCLVWDRHTDIYASASQEEKALLEKTANGE